MASYKQIVAQCGKIIEASQFKDLLLPLWNEVEWKGHGESIGSTAEADRNGEPVVHLYPELEKAPDALKQVLRAFGHYVLGKAGERGTAIWTNKLDVPTSDDVQTVKRKLEDPELRKTCKSYKDVLDTFEPEERSVCRLVFINIVNALLANNISYADSVGVDIMTWGPSAEYANGKKYHSLIPLVSAYSPAEIFNDFGSALAVTLLSKTGAIRESSVSYAFRGILQRVVRIASPA